MNTRKPEQYRIVNHCTYYTVLISWGLLDTTVLIPEVSDDIKFVSVRECRENIKIHASRFGILNPIILR